MSGTVIIGIGIGAIVLAFILFGASMVYRSTTGKKIREELNKEYDS